MKSKSGKKYLLFDPTSEYTPLGELPSYAENNYVLLVADGSGELLLLPELDPATNVLERTGKFQARNPDGTLAGEVVEDRTGYQLHAGHAMLSKPLTNNNDLNTSRAF